MKKRFVLLIAIVVGIFVLQGCSKSNSLNTSKPNSFPVGHDMHHEADPQKKQKEDETHPLKGYS